MTSKDLNALTGLTIALVIVGLIAFAILRWLGVYTGNFLEWSLGVAIFWWLAVVVTIPWNVHFKAKQVAMEGKQSREKGIRVNRESLDYVNVIVRRSLAIAIALHGVSALAFYLLAVTGVSAIGYIGSGAALLLTGLRPAIAFYQYLSARLQEIDQAVKYPREDIAEVRDRLLSLEQGLQQLSDQVNPDKPNSVTASQQRQLEAIRQDLTGLSTSHRTLQAQNTADHDRLAREAQGAISKLNADAEFLDRARELIRFFKEA
jgi:hypothetical protein